MTTEGVRHDRGGGHIGGQAWQGLRKLIQVGDTRGTTRYVTELDDAGRKEIAAELPRYVTSTGPDMGWYEWRPQVSPLLVAGAACLGGASAVTAWLFRREFRRRHDHGDLEPLLTVLRPRPAKWQADLARRLAARLRLPDLQHWTLAAQLIRETGTRPPDDQAFLAGWLRALRPSTATGDPLFAAYKGRIFEVDGLDDNSLRQVTDTIMRLLQEGLIERTATIDGVVGRLLRDGPSARAQYADLHDRLDLDLDEAAARAGDYTRLLPAGPVVVADLALAQLRRLEEAGRLDGELFAEALVALTFRPEKKLLRAALTWAADAVMRDAARTDVVLEAVAALFTQDTLALQERAVRLAVKLAPKAGQTGRDAVRQAATELTGDLLEKVSAAYGGGIAEAESPAAPPLVAGEGPRMPPPIASPEDLVRELETLASSPDVHTYERLLAGLAEWSHRAPEALRAAYLRRNPAPHTYGDYGGTLYEGLPETVGRAFLAFAAPDVSRALHGKEQRTLTAASPLDLLFLRRALELTTPFETGTGYPVLLATPTAGTGHLDPATLLDRLELLESTGVRPLPADLAQALLRLPRTFAIADIDRAARLTTEAGREVAAWMRNGGLPDPTVTVTLRRHRDVPGYHAYRLDLTLTEPGDDVPELIRALFRTETCYGHLAGWWPLILPAHREIVAAHVVRHLYDANDAAGAYLPPDLIHGDGRPGPALSCALALGLGRPNGPDRYTAIDTFLTLAARDEVPAEALAEVVTTLVTKGLVKLNRVVSALDDATQAGAHEAVWAVIMALLPGLLPEEGERPRPGVADLLAAGTRAARIAGARTILPEVAAVAARKGSSRLVLEARRLTRQVTPT